MDQLFDRFGNLLRSLFQDERGPRRSGPVDPDEQAAWEELDEFMRTGKQRPQNTESKTRTKASASGSERPFPESLRIDYANLEVSVEASDEELHRAYKRMVREYHPDRFASDTRRLAYATEITQKINASYQRIRRYRATGKL